MKTTTEKINGQLYTVAWYGYQPRHSTLGKRFCNLAGGALAVFNDADCLDHTATALPALPRYPEPEHARLLWRYFSEGVYIYGIFTDVRKGIKKETQLLVDTFGISEPYVGIMGYEGIEPVNKDFGELFEITHAIDTKTYERVEIAIYDNEKGE